MLQLHNRTTTHGRAVDTAKLLHKVNPLYVLVKVTLDTQAGAND